MSRNFFGLAQKWETINTFIGLFNPEITIILRLLLHEENRHRLVSPLRVGLSEDSSPPPPEVRIFRYIGLLCGDRLSRACLSCWSSSCWIWGGTSEPSLRPLGPPPPLPVCVCVCVCVCMRVCTRAHASCHLPVWLQVYIVCVCVWVFLHKVQHCIHDNICEGEKQSTSLTASCTHLTVVRGVQ